MRLIGEMPSPRLFATANIMSATRPAPARDTRGIMSLEPVAVVPANITNRTTVRPAPAFIPSSPGSARSLRVTPCIMHPDTASPAPTRMAMTILGMR